VHNIWDNSIIMEKTESTSTDIFRWCQQTGKLAGGNGTWHLRFWAWDEFDTFNLGSTVPNLPYRDIFRFVGCVILWSELEPFSHVPRTTFSIDSISLYNLRTWLYKITQLIMSYFHCFIFIENLWTPRLYSIRQYVMFTGSVFHHSTWQEFHMYIYTANRLLPVNVKANTELSGMTFIMTTAPTIATTISLITP